MLEQLEMHKTVQEKWQKGVDKPLAIWYNNYRNKERTG